MNALVNVYPSLPSRLLTYHNCQLYLFRYLTFFTPTTLPYYSIPFLSHHSTPNNVINCQYVYGFLVLLFAPQGPQGPIGFKGEKGKEGLRVRTGVLIVVVVPSNVSLHIFSTKHLSLRIHILCPSFTDVTAWQVLCFFCM